MLTGDGPNHITLTNSNARSLNQFIPFIKCIRMATGLGLKEAKDIADLVEVGKSQKIKIIPTADKNAIKRELMTMRVSFL
jgi:ribosomal protein L7/L12